MGTYSPKCNPHARIYNPEEWIASRNFPVPLGSLLPITNLMCSWNLLEASPKRFNSGALLYLKKYSPNGQVIKLLILKGRISVFTHISQKALKEYRSYPSLIFFVSPFFTLPAFFTLQTPVCQSHSLPNISFLCLLPTPLM